MRNNFESNEISVSPELDNRDERKFNDLPEDTRRTWTARLQGALKKIGIHIKADAVPQEVLPEAVNDQVVAVVSKKASTAMRQEKQSNTKQSRSRLPRTPIFSHSSAPTIFADKENPAATVDVAVSDLIVTKPDSYVLYAPKVDQEAIKQERILEAVREIESSPTFEQKFKTLETYLAKPSNSRSRIGTINGELALAVESKPVAIGSEIVEEIYGQVSFAIKTTESNRKKITELEEELADLKAAGVPESFERKQKQGKKQISVQEENEDYRERRTRINELRNEMNRVAHDVQVYIAEIGSRPHEDLIQGTTHFAEAVQDDLAERERRKQMAIQAIEDSFKPKQVPVRLAA